MKQDTNRETVTPPLRMQCPMSTWLQQLPHGDVAIECAHGVVLVENEKQVC